jgi:hypothetical protein
LEGAIATFRTKAAMQAQPQSDRCPCSQRNKPFFFASHVQNIGRVIVAQSAEVSARYQCMILMRC